MDIFFKEFFHSGSFSVTFKAVEVGGVKEKGVTLHDPEGP